MTSGKHSTEQVGTEGGLDFRRDHETATVQGDGIDDFLTRIGAESAGARERLAALSREAREPVEEIVLAIVELAPRGWSLMSMHASVVRRALQAVAAGSGDEADQILADQFDGQSADRLERICARVAGMAAEDPERHRLFGERSRLLKLASGHHLAGRYDASIPILLAQIEGIAMDVTDGKKFFTKGSQKADLSSPDRTVNLLGGLTALQVIFGQDVQQTQSEGNLSRHGVLHGRELAYDTRVNSAKTWSVLDALVEWSSPGCVAKT